MRTTKSSQLIVAIIGSLFMILPLIFGISAPYNILAIFIGAILMWLFVDVGYPSILVLVALSFIPDIGFSNVISASFGNTTIMFLIFSFIVAYSLNKHGVLRRVANLFIYSSISNKSYIHLFLMVNIAVLLIGAFMAPTVTFIIFLPILEEIYKSLGMRRNLFIKLLTSSVAITTSISCAITPFHHSH